MARRLPAEPEVLRVPQVPWRQLEAHIVSSWRPGEHVTLIGPAGAGKTHAALTLGEMCRHTLVLATKRRDPLVSELSRGGYTLVSSMREIPLTAEGDQPVHHRVLLWARAEGDSERQRQALQASVLRDALSTAERQGKWCVVIDETMWLTNNLRLQTELDSLWFQARSSGVSVVACAQRPSHVPLLALSQATYLLLWRVSDRRDIERLREISGGIPMQVIEENVGALDWRAHEFLFVDTRSGHIARSVMPAR